MPFVTTIPTLDVRAFELVRPIVKVDRTPFLDGPALGALNRQRLAVTVSPNVLAAL